MTDRLSLEALSNRIADNPVALARLAGIAFNKGNTDDAYRMALRARRQSPDDPEVVSLTSTVLSAGVPSWHFGIVRDLARNQAYDEALHRAVKPGLKVFEIGTGSGILAMMAARAGATEVITCEMNRAVADAAADVVALNGYAGRVRIIPRKSTELDAAADLGGRADIFVSEIVDNMILGEYMLPMTEHAFRALLKPDAKVIPARGMVRVALAHDDMLFKKRIGNLSGFDLSPMNRVAANFYRVERGNPRLKLLSDPVTLFDFDFQSGGPYKAGEAAVEVVSRGGRANGVAQWIALKMDEEGWYENAPEDGATSAWAVIFRPFLSERDYPAGARMTIHGSHDMKSLRVWA
jgi:type III protein arginine methyltransferase